MRQHVVLGPNLTGFGNLPVFTPAHHVLLLTGIGPRGAKIEESRRNPVCGNVKTSGIDHLRRVEDGDDLLSPMVPVTEFGLSETEFGFS